MGTAGVVSDATDILVVRISPYNIAVALVSSIAIWKLVVGGIRKTKKLGISLIDNGTLFMFQLVACAHS